MSAWFAEAGDECWGGLQKQVQESLNDEMGKLVARQRETTKNAKVKRV